MDKMQADTLAQLIRIGNDPGHPQTVRYGRLNYASTDLQHRDCHVPDFDRLPLSSTLPVTGRSQP